MFRHQIREFVKVNMEDDGEEMKDIACIALKDFAQRMNIDEPKLLSLGEPQYSSYHGCFTLYHLNLSLQFPPDSVMKCPNSSKKNECTIESMLFKGLIYEKIEICRLGTRLPPLDKRGSSKDLAFQRPDLKESALGQLVDKLEDLGLSIDQPSNTLMPVLAWESSVLDRRDIGAGFDVRNQHSIIVRVKPPRGKKSKPGLHGLWTVTVCERKWVYSFSPELIDGVKKGISEVWKKEFPSRLPITHDPKTGRARCSVRALSHSDPVFLATPRIVTLALFALDNYNIKKGLKLKFERVIDARMWRSSCITHLLTLEASDEGNITHCFMTSVRIVPSLELIESTPLVKQENDLPKEVKQLFKLGESTGGCCSEENVDE